MVDKKSTGEAVRCKQDGCKFYAVKNGLCSGCSGGMKCKQNGCEFYGVKDGLCTGCAKSLHQWKKFIATPAQMAALQDMVKSGQIITATKLFQYMRDHQILLTAQQAYTIVDLFKVPDDVRLWDAVCCRVHDWKTLKACHGREGYYEAAAATPLDWDYFAPLQNGGNGRDDEWEFQ